MLSWAPAKRAGHEVGWSLSASVEVTQVITASSWSGDPLLYPATELRPSGGWVQRSILYALMVILYPHRILSAECELLEGGGSLCSLGAVAALPVALGALGGFSGSLCPLTGVPNPAG